MSTEKIALEVKEGLDNEFDGACNSYSIFYVFGANRSEVEPVLVELGEDFVSGYDSGTDGVFAFVDWENGVYFAKELSEKLPGKLVVGETSWDNFEIMIMKDGAPAVKEKDYLFYLEYEENEDEPDYSDTMYSFTDVSTGFTVESGAGMTFNKDMKEVLKLTTGSKDSIDLDKWYGEIERD